MSRQVAYRDEQGSRYIMTVFVPREYDAHFTDRKYIGITGFSGNTPKEIKIFAIMNFTHEEFINSPWPHRFRSYENITFHDRHSSV